MQAVKDASSSLKSFEDQIEHASNAIRAAANEWDADDDIVAAALRIAEEMRRLAQAAREQNRKEIILRARNIAALVKSEIIEYANKRRDGCKVRESLRQQHFQMLTVFPLQGSWRPQRAFDRNDCSELFLDAVEDYCVRQGRGSRCRKGQNCREPARGLLSRFVASRFFHAIILPFFFFSKGISSSMRQTLKAAQSAKLLQK